MICDKSFSPEKITSGNIFYHRLKKYILKLVLSKIQQSLLTFFNYQFNL